MGKHYKKIMEMISFRTLLIIVLIFTGLLQFLLMLGNVRGTTYDIQAFQLAPETIRAVKTVEDTVKTEQERDHAEESIEPVYVYNEETAKHRVALVNSLFDIVSDVRTEVKGKDAEASIDNQITQLRNKLKEITDSQSQLIFTNSQLQSLMTVSDASIHNAMKIVSDLVETTLSDAIRIEEINLKRNEIETKIRQAPNLDVEILNAVIVIGRAAIIETETLDETKTKELIHKAREEVEPTRILQGQIIVQEGELINREVYRQLELLGLLNNQATIKPVVGLAIFVLLQMSFLYILFIRSKMELTKKRNAVLVTVIVYAMSIILMKLLGQLTDQFDVTIAFLYPTALATMLVRLLANERAATLVTVLTAASAGVMFHEGYAAVLQMDIALYIIFGGLASIFFMRSIEKRSHLLKACGVVSIVNIAFIGFYLLMSQSDYGLSEQLFYGVAGITSGIVSGALTMGLLPFFESAFGILSTMKLIELSNPNHPLLKKLLTETPGTYHHSVMVANLAEAACEAIGADGLLARVGCYYHDLGKTKRPAFFIENQMSGINPHDSLPPERSAEIIIAHTTDGAKLLESYKMPKEIIDIALQHHGTSTLKFFLHKAKEEGKDIEEKAFMYPGPKPQTKEAAVISIADSVEAAVRSMKQPNAEKIQKLVYSIIQGRVQENQFDECDVSIKELKKIEVVLCETLNGIFHSRIEYPKDE
ncbi:MULTISPECIES: HD family phosphohydrolase [Lysinibacillus]|uniref:HDIG domain-containing protein n=1 Tax=Lysinibacillus antri TaxID=2498145 RepID=A0A432LIZ4_9BACI|nr:MULTISPECIES: HDIG domain-containing metalloprotein [Lysinibacillus]RUL57043.1 HDIG domain-containing protein [Lysinibacillus antri]TSI03324.1 HDIG domain-containing protein [Lysinibacillus sp. BW-2-10]